MTSKHFMSLGAGVVGHVNKMPAVAMVIDLIENRLLVVQGGKPFEWIPFDGFIMDGRGMRTGSDIEKDIRGF